ncbi:lysozyme inhibitor LprI family protein [Burkholderia vietnamiensis]|uniref:lysozyme inhibitor LprI family protein n=1 Tax=Burkholderia vietnamiensis TaxID=60552 RepID=UPI00158CB6CD|nr:lysozyme inhibitor LprI family protein [Burkholderia vietnamiensis]
MDINEMQKHINVFLQNDWVKVFAIPALYGIFLFGKYLVERRIERKPETENIAQLNQLADLKEKLDKSGTTLEELQNFRAKALGRTASVAVVIAQQYTEAASQLVGDAENAEHDPDWDSALTQTDMNIVSMKKASQADDELTAIVNSKMREFGEEDRQLLQQSQSAWVAYRDTEIKRASRIWEGGTIRPLMVNLRYEAITRERIAGLAAEGRMEDTGDLVVELAKTPRNLLQHIEPGVPKQRVYDILGTPSFVSANFSYYRYEETQVEISFNDNDAVNDVIVALIQGQVYLGSSPGFVTDIPLGKLTLADVLGHDDQLMVEFRSSLRTQEVYVQGRTGPAGAWTYFCFGALSVFSGAGNLQDTQFEWDRETNRLLTDPKDILINWMALPGSSLEPPYFSWFIK